jgi:hypothetical protein
MSLTLNTIVFTVRPLTSFIRCRQILTAAQQHPLFHSSGEALPTNKCLTQSAAQPEGGCVALVPSSGNKTQTELGTGRDQDPSGQRSSTAVAALHQTASAGGINSTAAQRGGGGFATPGSVAAQGPQESHHQHRQHAKIATAACSTPASMVLGRMGATGSYSFGGTAGKSSAMRLTSGSYKLAGMTLGYISQV